jgi:uncharacterized lipoprotein YddW (UPF0748 family)/N-acetylmuramoyl-L-alanine amidase
MAGLLSIHGRDHKSSLEACFKGICCVFRSTIQFNGGIDCLGDMSLEGYILLRSLRKQGRLNWQLPFALCVFFIFCTVVSGTVAINSAGGLAYLLFGQSKATTVAMLKADTGLHGVWVTTVGNADFPKKQGESVAQQKKEADAILDKVRAMGLNTIFLQVRPNSDALYKSSVYPWSAVLTGTQGKDPGYDPLAYFIDGAHKRGLKLSAWINPYRVQTVANKAALCATNPAKLHPAWAVPTSAGQLYYDPGLPAVRSMIEQGVLEIVKNYDVDGIVFDDYFYPEKNFADGATYKAYGAGLSLDDFRRDSVNKLINELHKKIKSLNPEIEFGVSPAGVWGNHSQNLLGCDTKGSYSSYYDQYADTRLWVKKNWVDFICPQIYWSIGDERADYKTVLKWWADTVNGTGVKLYIAHAVSKQGGGESGWNSPDQIVLQIREAEKYPAYKGSVFFDYSSLCQNTDGAADAIANYYKGKIRAASFGKTLTITSPTDNVTTQESRISITGSSDANFPLYLNGESVERSPDGYFSRVVSLNPGKNVFTLTHKGVTKTLTITCAAEVLTSVQPTQDITAVGGSQINISAVAHRDATVYANVGSTRVAMNASDSSGNDDNGDVTDNSSDYVTYTGTFTLPETKPDVQNLGRITVTALWGGNTKTLTGGQVRVKALEVKTGQHCVATVSPCSAVNKQYVETFLYADNMYRPVACPQPAGAWDYVETNADGTPKKYFYGSNSYYRLSCGLMFYSGDLSIEAKTAPAPNQVIGVAQGSAVRGRYTEFAFDFSSKVTYNAETDIDYQHSGYNTSGKRDYTVGSFNADSYSIYFFNTTKAAPISVRANPLFKSAYVSKVNSTTVKYTFKLKTPGKFYGANVYYNSKGRLVIDFKNPWDGKLSDLRISIDPGHGGIDFGAVAGKVNEKSINLKFSLAVRDILIKKYHLKSSNIYMTRTTDTLIAATKGQDLQLRTYNMVRFGSDLSLCIHQNDGGGEGFETYYFQPYSEELAASVQSNLATAYKNCGYAFTDRGYKFCSETAYYACRQPQFPSILVECGFIDNAKDRGFLTSKKGAGAIASALAKSAVEYAQQNMR